jgi:hypothetical protein
MVHSLTASNIFAHTSPVYAIVDGKPIRSWDDAQYYVGYMQHAIDWLKTEARFASAEVISLL